MSEQPAAAAEGEEAPAKAGPKGVVLIGALVVTLLIGGAAGVFAVGPMVAKKSGYVVVPDSGAHAAGGEAAEGEDGDHGGAEGKEGDGAATANLHLIDNLVLNPAGSGGSRFLMLAAALELKESAQIEELKAKDAEARDVVLRVMGARTVEELSEMGNREALKQALADSLSPLLKKKQSIRRVYFPQFVIQ